MATPGQAGLLPGSARDITFAKGSPIAFGGKGFSGAGLPAGETGLGSFLGPIGTAIDVGQTALSAFRGDAGGVARGVGTLAGAKLGTAIGGPGIGTLVGSAIGTFAGGFVGSKLGPGDSRRNIPIGGIQPDEFPAAKILSEQNINTQPFRLQEFRNFNSAFNPAKKNVQNAANVTTLRLRLIGRNDLADKMEKEIERSNRTPTSPGAGFQQLDQLVEILNRQEFAIEQELANIQNDPVARKNFEVRGGLNFETNFLPEFNRQTDVLIAQNVLPAAQKRRSDKAARFERPNLRKSKGKTVGAGRKASVQIEELARTDPAFLKIKGKKTKGSISEQKKVKIAEALEAARERATVKVLKDLGITGAQARLEDLTGRSQRTESLFDLTNFSSRGVFGEFTGDPNAGLGQFGEGGFAVPSPELGVSGESLGKLNFFREEDVGSRSDATRNLGRRAFTEQDRARA